ncbi:hypothetical protein CLOM621_08040 [Clostridium sp. M62/1]|nr:hypothetical protein CLOM621_08040 [Clostridium sp. M62/1]
MFFTFILEKSYYCVIMENSSILMAENRPAGCRLSPCHEISSQG